MNTVKLTTYRQFVAHGRPYIPAMDLRGRIVLPNFATCDDTTAIKNAKRLVISSGVVYNRGDFCAVWVVSVSRVGYRWRWLYWRGERRVTWHELTWDEKRKVVAGYARNQSAIPFVYAPTKHFQKWLAL